jgi:hypothetical protein
MSERKELPDPVYAAAGAGEAALEKLRKLPETAARTWRTANATAEGLRDRYRGGDRDLAGGLASVRESARSGAATLVARAATAQERAVTGYRHLVARGERVVSERFGLATGKAEPPRRVEVEVGDIRRDGVQRDRIGDDPGTGEAGKTGAV